MHGVGVDKDTEYLNDIEFLRILDIYPKPLEIIPIKDNIFIEISIERWLEKLACYIHCED